MIPYWSDIKAAAAVHGLDAHLVGGLVMTESGGNPWAWNPEDRYRFLWDVKAHKPFRSLTLAERAASFPPLDFHSISGDPDNEWWGQRASWGLMQVMGAVGRELGFAGPYLPELCDPVKNLVVGCKKLSILMDWAKGDAVQALAAYNGGQGNNASAPFANRPYAEKVLHASSVLEV